MSIRNIASVAVVRKLHDPLSRQEDRKYWLGQSPISRFNAVDEIRQEFHLWKYGNEPRFQRVYRIIKHK